MSPMNVKNMTSLNGQLVEAFFNLVCGFAINCFKAERACEDSLESKKYLESYEKVLVSWTSLKNSLDLTDPANKQFSLIVFKNYSQTIVEAFIQSRLSFNLDSDQVNYSGDYYLN